MYWQSEKNLLNIDTSSTCPHSLANFGLLTAKICLASLGHPCKFPWLSRLGSVTARHSSSGSQPNFAALNRGRHLYLAGRPSRWALAHILVYTISTKIMVLPCGTFVQTLKLADFFLLFKTTEFHPSQVLSAGFDHCKFITQSIHLCWQHINRDSVAWRVCNSWTSCCIRYYYCAQNVQDGLITSKPLY